MTDELVKVRIRNEDEDQEANVWCLRDQAEIGNNIEVNILDGLWEIIQVFPELTHRVD
jgi:hypothetical protein